jgi:hypothetical protein
VDGSSTGTFDGAGNELSFMLVVVKDTNRHPKNRNHPGNPGLDEVL